MTEEKIDIIIPWVDGSDPKWLEEKNKYDSSSSVNSGNSDSRYRDWNLMRYLFRGIEKNMPWVNKVFFVTWGHITEWLNTANEKLVIVRHEDYIPKEYLPTFNSNVIELNYHRIADLSENFIVFNDDFCVVDETSPDSFFKNGKPRDMLLAKTMVNYDRTSYIWHMTFNNMGVVNKYFKGGKEAFKHFSKWVNPRYGFRNNIENLMKIPFCRLSAFYDFHITVAAKKSVYKKIWDLEGDYLDEICHNRFRTPLDLSTWLMRYWNLASGEFEPIDMVKLGKYYEFGDTDASVEVMCEAIRKKERPVLVINDTLCDANEVKIEKYKEMLGKALGSVLPDKCSFEM